MAFDATAGRALLELQRRQYDALSCFRPVHHDDPEQSQEEYFRCRATQKLISGGNQSGKTTVTCVRDAAFLLDREVTFRDGTKVHARKSIHRGKPVLMWVVGLQLNHIGQTIYPKLFLPGAFKLIRDPHTKLMRAWNPRLEYDAAYEEKAVPAPPLIPESEICENGIAWTYKAEHQFSTVNLKNGSRLCAYASTSDVKQGDQVHRIHVDEAIDNPNHYNEWLQRIAPVQGEIDWSTWPTIDPNTALISLWDLCNRDKSRPKPRGVMFRFPQMNNPYLPKETREEILSTGQMDEEEAQARSEGLFVMDKRRMYPKFSKRTHSLLAFDPVDDDLIAAECRKEGQIPPGWTRYLALDPGTSHPAVLFGAVPPTKLGSAIVIYDELYPGRMDADDLATLIAGKIGGQTFEAFIIDDHAARKTPEGIGFTIGDNYSRAFRQRHLTCRRTGSRFIKGSDDVMGRIGMVQACMNVDDHTRLPVLRIWTERCPHLVNQLQNYRKAVDPKTKTVLEQIDKKQKNDVAVCLEYLVSIEPRYIPPSVMDGDHIKNRLSQMASMFGLGGRKSDKVHCGPGVANAP